MKLITNFVNSLKYFTLNDKRVTIFLTPNDVEVKVKVKLKEDEFEKFTQEFADFNHFWYNNISESCLFSAVTNSTLEYKTVLDSKFDVEKVKYYGKLLKEYFESKGYNVAIIDLTFLNWLFK